MSQHTTSCWDYRRLSIQARPGSAGPELGSGPVEQLLYVVQDMERLKEKGWSLVSIAFQEDELGQEHYQVVLKRPRVQAATGEMNGRPSPGFTVGEDTDPSSTRLPGKTTGHSSRRRAA